MLIIPLCQIPLPEAKSCGELSILFNSALITFIMSLHAADTTTVQLLEPLTQFEFRYKHEH